MPATTKLDRRTLFTLLFLLAALVGLSVHRLRCAAPPGPYVDFGGQTMGTSYDVKVASDALRGASIRQLAAAVRTRLERVNSLMSTYDPSSEVSRFSANRSTAPFALSPETAWVLRTSEEVSERSGGAFDVTVAPLVAAWGFGATDRIPRPPPEDEIERLRERVGYRLLELDFERHSLRKTRPDVRLDLSAVAKGYGVDQVAEVLDQRGYHDYLVEVGGELRASGHKRDGSDWHVAIERPDSLPRAIYEVIALGDRSMATSGDYRNYYESNGVRLSHTIDPRTGHPIRHQLASVSVIHRNATHADAWATALDVLGPKEGYDLAVREGLAAYFILRESPDHFVHKATPAFERLFQKIHGTADETKPGPGAEPQSDRPSGYGASVR